MFFSFLYLTFRALFGLPIRSRRGPEAKDVELLVLRHELEVLRRRVGRPKLRRADRALLAAASHLPPAQPIGGESRRRDRLGGLLHDYYQAAA